MYSHYFKPNVKAIKRVSKQTISLYSEKYHEKIQIPHIQIDIQADINCK